MTFSFLCFGVNTTATFLISTSPHAAGRRAVPATGRLLLDNDRDAEPEAIGEVRAGRLVDEFPRQLRGLPGFAVAEGRFEFHGGPICALERRFGRLGVAEEGQFADEMLEEDLVEELPDEARAAISIMTLKVPENGLALPGPAGLAPLGELQRAQARGEAKHRVVAVEATPKLPGF